MVLENTGTTIIIVGPDADPAVRQAVVDLLKAVAPKTEEAEAISPPPVHSYGELLSRTDFVGLLEGLGLPEKRVREAARRLFRGLFFYNTHPPEKLRSLVFVCVRCGLIKGVCRCPEKGHQNHYATRWGRPEWAYDTGANDLDSWRVTVDSLLALPDVEINRLHPQRATQLRQLIATLRTRQSQ